MGAQYQTALAKDQAYHTGIYARKPVMFVRGAGMTLIDDDGNEYLDFVSGLGAVNLGHGHPAVASAVAVQAAKLVHVTNLYQVEHRSELAEALVSLAGGGMKAFFCNSGAEASEGAIKLARKWGIANRGAECTRIITAKDSFHGRTLASLAATGQPAKQNVFPPVSQGFSHVPLNDLDALKAQIDESVCAVMLEPIQGEGGVWPCEPGYLQGARKLCDEHGILLVLDEVQTGFWRTGPAFAHQAYGIEPDILTLAKAMANGLPIGAVLSTEDVAQAFAPGDHGSTFAGGPVVCAAALATIDEMRAQRLGENATKIGSYLEDGLRSLADRTGAISQVRGAGLMLAAQLVEPCAGEVAGNALDRGIVLNNIGDSVLRFLPPLVCSSEDVDALLSVLTDLLEQGGACA